MNDDPSKTLKSQKTQSRVKRTPLVPSASMTDPHHDWTNHDSSTNRMVRRWICLFHMTVAKQENHFLNIKHFQKEKKGERERKTLFPKLDLL